MADAGLRALAGGGVGKSAGPVWDAQAPDARQLAGRVVPAWAAALCKQDVVRFAGRSSAAAVWPVALVLRALRKRVPQAQQVVRPGARILARSVPSEQRRVELVAQRDVAAQRPSGPQAMELEHSASPQAELAASPAVPEALQQPDGPRSAA
jgi:hypothetical protein